MIYSEAVGSSQLVPERKPEALGENTDTYKEHIGVDITVPS
jgi:hypothetical protein